MRFYWQHIFMLEQEEYKKEGVDWKEIKWVDNAPLLELFMARPIGIMALLDEESQFPRVSYLTPMIFWHCWVKKPVLKCK